MGDTRSTTFLARINKAAGSRWRALFVLSPFRLLNHGIAPQKEQTMSHDLSDLDDSACLLGRPSLRRCIFADGVGQAAASDLSALQGR